MLLKTLYFLFHVFAGSLLGSFLRSHRFTGRLVVHLVHISHLQVLFLSIVGVPAERLPVDYQFVLIIDFWVDGGPPILIVPGGTNSGVLGGRVDFEGERGLPEMHSGGAGGHTSNGIYVAKHRNIWLIHIYNPISINSPLRHHEKDSSGSPPRRRRYLCRCIIFQ